MSFLKSSPRYFLDYFDSRRAGDRDSRPRASTIDFAKNDNPDLRLIKNTLFKDVNDSQGANKKNAIVEFIVAHKTFV